jgi:hypothetical protein
MDSKVRDDDFIKKLDQTIGECCDIGERKCSKTRKEWWTLEVNRLRIWRRNLQKLQSSFKNKINITERIQASLDESNINRELPTNLADTTTAITQARKDIRASLDRSKETRHLSKSNGYPWNATATILTRPKYLPKYTILNKTHKCTACSVIFAGNHNLADSPPLKYRIPGPHPAKPAIGATPKHTTSRTNHFGNSPSHPRSNTT